MMSFETVVLKPRKILPTHAQGVRSCQNKHCHFLNCLNLHLLVLVSSVPCRRVRSGDVVNRHMTFPTWALFKPEEKGMWPLQVICGILQLCINPNLLFSHSTSCPQCMCVSGVWTSAAAWVLKTDTSRHRCNTLADFAETFSLCHGLKSQSTWAQAVQASCSLQRTPDLCHLKSLWRLFYLCFPSYTGCGIAVLYFTAHFFEAKLLCTL